MYIRIDKIVKRKLKVMTFCMDQTKGIYLLFHTEKY
nr:MAG TPA: hypothetical protein [Caudoviricetes sp.]